MLIGILSYQYGHNVTHELQQIKTPIYTTAHNIIAVKFSLLLLYANRTANQSSNCHLIESNFQLCAHVILSNDHHMCGLLQIASLYRLYSTYQIAST